MAAAPKPTINRDIIIKIREFAKADRSVPKVNTVIPKSKVLLLPNRSAILPKMGAKAAVDMACAKAVQVVLL